MGLIKKLLLAFIIIAIVAGLLWYFEIPPFAQYINSVVYAITHLDLANISVNALAPFITIFTGFIGLAAAAWKKIKDKATALKASEQKAAQQATEYKSNVDTVVTENLEKTKALETQAKQITSLEEQKNQADTAKLAAEQKLLETQKENEHLQVQVKSLSDQIKVNSTAASDPRVIDAKTPKLP